MVQIEFNKAQLQVLLYILDDWRTMKSDFEQPAIYPNLSTTSTKLVRLINAIINDMK